MGFGVGQGAVHALKLQRIALRTIWPAGRALHLLCEPAMRRNRIVYELEEQGTSIRTFRTRLAHVDHVPCTFLAI
jgi:hypothetical protein